MGKCRGVVNAEQVAEIECPNCDGDGCGECEDGFFKVAECPSQYIGASLISDIQLTAATEHHLPNAGGLLDQSSWWFELRQAMQREEHLISEEQATRRNL